MPEPDSASITRRDFLDGVALTIAAGLTAFFVTRLTKNLAQREADLSQRHRGMTRIGAVNSPLQIPDSKASPMPNGSIRWWLADSIHQP